MKTYSRTDPYRARIKERELISGEGSSKKTFHVVLDISLWDGIFKVGDSVAILPANDPLEVQLILEEMRWDSSLSVLDPKSGRPLSLFDFLTYKANLSKGIRHAGAAQEGKTFRQSIRGTSFSVNEVISQTAPLLPRFYSIANSPLVFPEEIHLLVAYVEYELEGQKRRGVGSYFLCDLAEIESTPVPLYVQPSHHFTLPEDPSSSIILIGPGTGVAPYRAFLQQRIATQSSGRNWLFFGERNEGTDFYYRDFWKEMEKQGRLRLDVAFSRDQEEKVYVQHRMWERRKSLWSWIQEGAFLYVCGDAKQMAKDVDAMLHQIVKQEGAFSEEEAHQYIKMLRREKRYLIDVY